ncbi:MAG TPA: hypothetical protein VL985_10835 [Stellaceae bacterium]|nr:hypothetical protein [Stellaceae bacterium]
MPDKFVLVVDRALVDPDIDPAPAQIVEQRQLDGEPYRMMEGQLHDGEADPDPLGAHRDSRGEQQRVVVDALAGEVMLGQPDIAEPEPLGKAHLLDLLVDAIGVLIRRRRQ